MLGENQTETSSRSSDREFNPQYLAHTAVSAAERFARHGHRPAIVLAEGRGALAGLLERALFQRGFEVLLASAAEVSSQEHFLALAKGARAAGLVLIYSAAELDVSAKHALNVLAAKDFFDLTAEPLPADDHAALETILPRFELLRIRRGSGDPEKVN
jgi:hypothetical protein